MGGKRQGFPLGPNPSAGDRQGENRPCPCPGLTLGSAGRGVRNGPPSQPWPPHCGLLWGGPWQRIPPTKPLNQPSPARGSAETHLSDAVGPSAHLVPFLDLAPAPTGVCHGRFPPCKPLAQLGARQCPIPAPALPVRHWGQAGIKETDPCPGPRLPTGVCHRGLSPMPPLPSMALSLSSSPSGLPAATGGMC